ncbi:MAG TPA: replication initiator protein A [Gemmatimonadaceae bacterium]|nr:replication initiator protein A [Gemmatimonadaceae bacterium]
MNTPARHRLAARKVSLDRSLEVVPLFRLGDSPEDTPVVFTTDTGGRWRVLPAPEDRLPGTFDQDVYVELMRRYDEAGRPSDGTIAFTLHNFLRSLGRRVDGRTYELLRAALFRLHRTLLEATAAWHVPGAAEPSDVRFSVLSALVIERRRAADHHQLALFDASMGPDPGEVRATLAPVLRDNLADRYVTTISLPRYRRLTSPVARRLYRLVELARAEGRLAWRVPLERLKDLLPLVQRYPSHLQRVLQPAHDLLLSAGVLRSAAFRQHQRKWFADYVLGSREPGTLEGRPPGGSAPPGTTPATPV